MSLLQTLRADGEKLLETEIPSSVEIAKVVGALVKRLGDDVLKDLEPAAPVEADPAAPPADAAPVEATPAEKLKAALDSLGVSSVDAAVELLDELQTEAQA